MKNFALVIAFALLAAVPASAAEICKAAPTTALEQQTQEAIPLFAGLARPVLVPVPRCYTLDGTSCPAAGATTACTDVCHNSLSCTCYNSYGGPYSTTFLGRFWNCYDEC